MYNKKDFFVRTILVAILGISITASLTLVNGQLTPTRTATPIARDPLPVLLIHGYASDSSVWKTWEGLLRNDGIKFKAVNFSSNDRCGSSAAHAKELNKIVKDFERETGARQINIVAHSKGGLDSRVYLANSSINDVANLIMIGTPNAGAPLASPNDKCSPAVKDFIDHAPATQASRNLHTQYYTIAGNWNPLSLLNCPPSEWLAFEEWASWQIPKPNDGLVPVSSVQSQGYFHKLGETSDCHTNLFTDIEYGKAKPILIGG